MRNFEKHFTTIVLSSYAIFLFYLLSTGAIAKFINPRLSFLSVIALLIIGVMIFRNLAKNSQQSKHSATCQCGHHEPEKFQPGNLLLFLPIFLSVMVGPGTLSYQPDNNPDSKNTAVVQNGGIATTTTINPNGVIVTRYTNPNQFADNNNTLNQNLSPGGSNQNQTTETENAQDVAAQFVPAGYEEYTQLNIGDTIFDTVRAPKQKLTHAKIFLRGKVIRSSLLKADEIIVYRVVITCCAADGMPLGIVVKLPAKLDFQPDEWVGVEGTVQLLPFDEKLKSIDPIAAMVPPEKIYPYFTADKAYQVQPPREEYLFP
jgi:putative membrane protein